MSLQFELDPGTVWHYRIMSVDIVACFGCAFILACVVFLATVMFIL